MTNDIAQLVERLHELSVNRNRCDNMSDRPMPKPWGDDVALRGPDAPKNNGQIKHLIEYLLTVYKRFGNTAVTCDLQWGASALWKRDELTSELTEARTQLAERDATIAQLRLDLEQALNDDREVL